MTEAISGLGAIIDRVDGVLVDQYGVLHDGRAPFAGARACLERLAERGTPAVAVTNSGKRSAPNLERLERLGFPPSLFKGLISSGELARAALVERLAVGALAPGDAIALLTRDGDASLLAGLDLVVAPPDRAPALVVIAGVEPEKTSFEAYLERLKPLAARGAQALCVNPDTVMYVDDGTAFGPGKVAEAYQSLGGAVDWLGKPAAPLFRAALGLLGAPATSRVLMIGDSVAHDIAGAQALGCRTLLVKGGVQSGTGDGSVLADFEIDRLVW